MGTILLLSKECVNGLRVVRVCVCENITEAISALASRAYMISSSFMHIKMFLNVMLGNNIYIYV